MLHILCDGCFRPLPLSMQQYQQEPEVNDLKKGPESSSGFVSCINWSNKNSCLPTCPYFAYKLWTPQLLYSQSWQNYLKILLNYFQFSGIIIVQSIYVRWKLYHKPILSVSNYKPDWMLKLMPAWWMIQKRFSHEPPFWPRCQGKLNRDCYRCFTLIISFNFILMMYNIMKSTCTWEVQYLPWNKIYTEQLGWA